MSVTTENKRGNKARRGGGKAPLPERIELDYSLAELPSAQHRAGLAGLVMMVRWLERASGEKKGLCELVRLDDSGATLALDRDGLRRLFDETYAASTEETFQKQPWRDKNKQIVEPLRIEEREVTDEKGKIKAEKLYVYPMIVPAAAMIADREPASPDGMTPWLKLWRDMVWSTLRGVPATRAPFEARAKGQASSDADDAWAELSTAADKSVDLPSTYYLGAQATTAENVPFRDRARYQFLLHFWPYAAQVYVPQVLKVKDAKTEFVGYAVLVPDVAALETFCDELSSALKRRGPERAAYRPREAVIDHPAESALDLASRIRQEIASRERATMDLVLGFEVFHLNKEGNSVRILSSARVEPAPQMVDAYVQLRGMKLWSHVFRRMRLVNLLDGKPWYTGFDRIIETLPQDKVTFGAEAFRHDARVSFELERKQIRSEVEMNDDESRKDEPVTLEDVIYGLMQGYVLQKLESKYGLSWDKVKDNEHKKGEFNEKKRKIAKDAFLAVRSRTGGDFVDYFAGTLCSVSHYLPRERYSLLSEALNKETERARTLTLLALSAVG